MLFVIAVLGVCLLISSLVSLSGGRREMELFEDEEGHRYRRWRRKRRRFGWKRSLSGVLLLVFALGLLWIATSVQAYLGLTSDIKVATVQATQFTGSNPPQMAVRLTTFDDHGNQLNSQMYQLNGDRWILMGDMIKFPTWMNIFGIHSGYKLTRLEGMYNDPNLESNDKHTVVTLNGGDDNFFKTVYKQAWSSPFVDAAYGNATYLPADDQVYNIYASQTGFYAKPANK
jgi:hypothetical protein